MFLVTRLATCWELGFLFGFYQGEIFMVSTKGENSGKSEFLTKFVEIIVAVIFM